MNEKYCRKCGKKLIVTYEVSKEEFDTRTGKPAKVRTAQCPDYRAGQPFIDGHSCFISKQ